MPSVDDPAVSCVDQKWSKLAAPWWGPSSGGGGGARLIPWGESKCGGARKRAVSAAAAAGGAAAAPVFSFGAAPAAGGSGGAGSGGAGSGGGSGSGGDGDGDGDAMPREATVEVARGDDGDEVARFESRCAMRRYDKGDGSEPPQWRDLGKGALRVMEHAATGAKRVVVRNDVGKVVLNFALAAAMKVRKTKAGVAVTACADDGGPKQYLLRTKVPLDAAHLAPATFLD